MYGLNQTRQETGVNEGKNMKHAVITNMSYNEMSLIKKGDSVLVKVLTNDPLQAGSHLGKVCKITKKAIQVSITTDKEKGYGFIVRVKKIIR